MLAYKGGRRAGQRQRLKGKGKKNTKPVPNFPFFPQWKAIFSLAVHEPFQTPVGHFPISKASQKVLNISDDFYERGQGESSYLECTLSYEDSRIQTIQDIPRKSMCWVNKEMIILSESISRVGGVTLFLCKCFCADHPRQIKC